jgi:hypothetical protein
MFMRVQIYGTLFIVLAYLMVIEGCVTTNLISPMEMPLSAYADRVSMKSIEKAIENALMKRGWGVDRRREGEIIATLEVRSHMVRIRLLYDSRRILAFYIDSKNMKYDGEVIHKKYHVWIDLLFKSIRESLISGRR